MAPPALTIPHRTRRRVGLWGVPMAKNLVNLDALIPREDFEETEPEPSSSTTKWPGLRIADLDPDRGVNFDSFRKPDFQRETSAWDAEMVSEFIHSFVKQDFLPPVIMWRSTKTGNFFVIDGGHRLSSLMAWVHDDYGDKSKSREFYEVISIDQLAAAETTRQLVNKAVGSYADLLAANRAKSGDPEKIKRFKDADAAAMPIHWVEGDARRAEDSFYSINLRATPIDPTEAMLIQSRRNPSAMASRAIIRRSAGHQYWGDFPEATRDDIKKEAKSIFDFLYVPEVEEKTMDLPIAGRSYGGGDSLSLVYNLGALANNMTELLKRLKRKEPQKSRRGAQKLEEKIEDDDLDGTETVKYLKTVRKVVERFTGKDPRSLGLHPIVYSYGITGRFPPSAFLATIGLIMEVEAANGLVRFTQNRALFEEFLLHHRAFTNQTVSKFGGQLKSYDRLLAYYKEVLRLIDQRFPFPKIKESLLTSKDFSYLKDSTNELTTMSANFSAAVNAVAFFRKAIHTAIVCEICHARINARSISHHHNLDRKYGGLGNADNNALVHFYCNN